jgi:hypothetical protein
MDDLLMWLEQCHKPSMTGNGKHSTYKHGDDSSYFDLGMVYEIVLTTIESLMDYTLLIDKLFISQSSNFLDISHLLVISVIYCNAVYGHIIGNDGSLLGCSGETNSFHGI